MNYAALFIPAKEGGYAVIFPDIPEALTQGETLEESLRMAAEALELSLEEYDKANKPWPDPASLEDINAILREEIEGEGVNKDNKPFIQIFKISRHRAVAPAERWFPDNNSRASHGMGH